MIPLVSILMPAYNHEHFISQAIESALNQKTTFPFELLIHDDKSTDKTRDIIDEYKSKFPDIIITIYQDQNQGLIKSYRNLLHIAKGKYIAILESDDCWTDEYKLQKQIDFLENNSNYGLIATSCNHINENNEVTFERIEKRFLNTDDWYELLIENCSLVAVTVCFRKSDFDKYCDIDEYVNLNFKTFDYETWLSISKNTKCKYLLDNTSSYRVLSTSISNNKNYKKSKEWENSCTKILLYVIEKYGCGKLTKRDLKYYINQKYLHRAIKYHNFIDYVYYSHFIKCNNIKNFFKKFFPICYYIQRKIRGKNV